MCYRELERENVEVGKGTKTWIIFPVRDDGRDQGGAVGMEREKRAYVNQLFRRLPGPRPFSQLISPKH